MSSTNDLTPFMPQGMRVYSIDGVSPTVRGGYNGVSGSPSSLVMVPVDAYCIQGNVIGRKDENVESAGFVYSMGSKAKGIGYEEETSPTLGTSGNAAVCYTASEKDVGIL